MEPSPSSPAPLVEVLALRPAPGAGGLLVAALTCPTAPGEPPDLTALRLACGPAAPLAGLVCHSTSWRFAGGRVVLTYAVLPDPAERADLHPVEEVPVLAATDPARPTPPGLHRHHVVAHALRHLTDLVATDPTVAGAAAEHPEVWRRVREQAARTRTTTRHDHGSRDHDPLHDGGPHGRCGGEGAAPPA